MVSKVRLNKLRYGQADSSEQLNVCDSETMTAFASCLLRQLIYCEDNESITSFLSGGTTFSEPYSLSYRRRSRARAAKVDEPVRGLATH